MVKSQPFLTEEDLQNLLNCKINCHPSQRETFNTILQLLWDSGARISELCNLTIQDFDKEEKFITLRNTKNKQDRIVPITDSMVEALHKLIGGRRKGFIFRGRGETAMGRMSVYQALKRRVAKAGINKNIRLHTFRHAFISRKLNAGKPLPAVQKFVGHSNLASTSLYYHFTQEDLRGVLNP